MKMMRIMQEKRKMKKNGRVLTVPIWSKRAENKNDSILRTFYFTFSGGVWSGICSVSESSENECDGDSTDADEQCKDDGNRDTDTGF